MTDFKTQLGEIIHKAEQELDELRLKIALGKMNGSDIFEDMKKDLLHSFREISEHAETNAGNLASEMKSKLEHLQVQLALGKAEALEVYEEQKQKLAEAIQQVENVIRDPKQVISEETRQRIQNELEKYRLKMEIVQIRYDLSRLDLKENLESRKLKFRKELEELAGRIKDGAASQLEESGAKLKNAFEALKNSLQD
jgi:hypothetical protein